MARKNQSKRLTEQHKESLGEIGIFGAEAKDMILWYVASQKKLLKN